MTVFLLFKNAFQADKNMTQTNVDYHKFNHFKLKTTWIIWLQEKHFNKILQDYDYRCRFKKAAISEKKLARFFSEQYNS